MKNTMSKISSYLPALSTNKYSIQKNVADILNYAMDSWFSKKDFRDMENSKNYNPIPHDLFSHIQKTWLGCDFSKCVTISASYPSWAVARNAWAFENLFCGEIPQYKKVDFISMYEYGSYLKDNYDFAIHSSTFKIAPNIECTLDVCGLFFVQTFSGKNLIAKIDFCHRSNSCSVSVLASPENKTEAESFLSAMAQSLVINDIYYKQNLSFDTGTFGFCNVIPTSWDQVILNSDIKERIRDNSISILSNMDELIKLNICPNRNLMLISPPGMAKTTIFRSMSCELIGKATIIWCTGKSILYPEHVSMLFEAARSMSPCIIFIEDMDLFGKDRSNSIDSSDNRILNEFLSCLDGAVENRGIVVMASTNSVASMDEALINRPGRFDVKIEIPLPTQEERNIMLKSFLETYNARPDDSVTIDTWKNTVDSTDGLTGAYIKDMAKAIVLRAVACGRINTDANGNSICYFNSDDMMTAVAQVMTNFAIGKKAKKHHNYEIDLSLNS